MKPSRERLCFTRWGLMLVAALLLAPAAGRGEDPPHYVRKDTWQESLTASQDAFTNYLERESAEAVTEGKKKVKVALGKWYATSSQRAKEGLKTPLPPEQGPVDVTALRNAEKNQPLWTEQKRWRDGSVIPLKIGEQCCQYFYRAIEAADEGTLTAYFGSDDGLAVWLNGKQVLFQDVARGVVPNQDRLTLTLAKGKNDLLLKVYNHGGDSALYFSTQEVPRNLMQEFRQGLWPLLERDFPDPQSRRQMQWEQEDRIWEVAWDDYVTRSLAKNYAKATRGAQAAEAKALADKFPPQDSDVKPIRDLYYLGRELQSVGPLLTGETVAALRRAIEDLSRTFPDRYPRGAEFLARVDKLGTTVAALAAESRPDLSAVRKAAAELERLRREALLANPLLDFDRLLVVKRGEKSHNLGLPQNWQGNCALSKTGYDNEIAVLSPVRPDGKLTTLYRPDGDKFVGDVDLHWDADRMLFSSIGANGRWQVCEVTADGKTVHEVTGGAEEPVDNYDACYLPDGRVLFASTRCFHGVPCVGGGNQVANLFLLDPDRREAGGGVRQITFDQDHAWCPTVMNDGRVLYARWEYSDSPHYFTRLLMRMNPDGTGQMAFYGSNSYWPNSTFYARPIPGDPTKVIAVISGHHGVPRMGELILFDAALGRFEADGVVQRIPGWGRKVEPVIKDQLVNDSWPRFLHPYPLGDPETGRGAGKYFLVSCQKDAYSPWALYLADVFDNLLPLYEAPGYAIFEPVPFRKTPRPPVIPDKVMPDRKDALVYLTDVYRGEAMRGVPRGTVKALRLYEFHYAYNQMGGHIHVGIDGPWDVHRIVGTVPVEADGSATFRVPANTPLAVQPLDAEGKAVQLMRSWFTAMPGEILSCVGCHERQDDASPNSRTLAATRPPAEIIPWRGPTRGFSFEREVQPVLDKYCVGCHNGQPRDGREIPDLRRDGKTRFNNFTPSYVALHPYVRRPGPESDYHVLAPMEYHADASELVQMLRKGHQNVKLDAEAWDRLVTWIDLNVPDKGTWSEYREIAKGVHDLRLEMRRKYAGIQDDPEAVLPTKVGPVAFVMPPALVRAAKAVDCPGWPFDAAEAKKRQDAAGATGGLPVSQRLDLGGGAALDLVLIPAGEFVMGDSAGWADEGPPERVRIDQPFYLGRVEVTNRQYALFDPAHDSGYISVYNKDQSTRGEAAHRDDQPVIRVSWREATAFCNWLTERTGRRFTLPTEAQWEYACRAGTAGAMNYGARDADFGKLANMADQRVNSLTRRDSPKWIPSAQAVDDGATITQSVGKYAPNAWGLHDMHGNVWEWTRSSYRPYPYADGDGRNDGNPSERKICRGGSFYDRPARCRSAMRLDYSSWQKVYNVGFRVVCPARPDKLAGAASTTIPQTSR